MIPADRLDLVLDRPAFTALQEPAAQRICFKDEFSRLAAEVDVEDTSEREAYRTLLARDVENLFATGGSLVVRISD